MTDIDIEHLIAEAERKFEEQDYAGAIEDFRFLAMQMPEDISYALNSIEVAEKQERLKFSRELSQQYPDSKEVILRHASLLIEDRQLDKAVARLSELIGSAENDVILEQRARRARLRATFRSHDYRLLVQDFLWLWEDSHLPKPKRIQIFARQHLLQQLAEVQRIEFIPILEELLERKMFSSGVTEFIEAKINELKLLSTAIAQMEEMKNDTDSYSS